MPASGLAADVFGDGGGHAGVKGGGVVGLALFAGKEEIDDLLRAGQGAYVGGEKGHGRLRFARVQRRF